LLSIFLGIVSCSGKEDENLEPSASGIENSNNGLKHLEGGESIHYKDLEKFLPSVIEGYEKEDPEGTSLNMAGFSVASASAEYTGPDGNYIRVSILDYNAAPSVYKTETAMWGKGITIDSDDEYAKSFSLNNELNGWESFQKINKKANVVVGIGNRLLISVQANNQLDAEKSKDILALVNFRSILMAINS
jgi:hypothetical protein